MKNFKKIFLLLIMMVVVIVFGSFTVNANSNFDAFYAEVESYGFNIVRKFQPRFIYPYNDDSNSEPYTEKLLRRNEFKTFVKEKLLHTTTIIDMVLQHKDNPDIKCYAYKVISAPKQPGRNWGFLGIGSYGDDFVQNYVKVSIDFPSSYEILSYVPENSPSKYTTSIGIGLSGEGPSVSASVSFDHNELTVISRTKTDEKHYEAIYDFDENMQTEYTKNEVASFGMILFRRAGSVNFNVNYEIKYHSIRGYEDGLSLLKKQFITHFAF